MVISKHYQHQILDSLLLILLGIIMLKCTIPTEIKKQLKNLMNFPNHYTNVYDFINNPMPSFIAYSIYIIGIYFLIKTYILEGDVVKRAHKKFAAHSNTIPVMIHGIGSIIEMTIGCIAVCNPNNPLLSKITAYIALFINIPSGAILTPRVFGIKYLTVSGFAKYGYLRSIEALRVLYIDHRLVPNLWILLQVGTVVRLLGWFILPYTSTDAKSRARGDLFTEPRIYSFNILLSGYLVAAFVYPPQFLIGSLILYAITQMFYPHNIKRRKGNSLK